MKLIFALALCSALVAAASSRTVDSEETRDAADSQERWLQTIRLDGDSIDLMPAFGFKKLANFDMPDRLLLTESR